MKKVIMVLLFVICSIGAFGQATLPINSKAVLRAYALEQSANVFVYFGSSLSLGDSSSRFVAVEGGTAAGISKAISSQSFAIDVANPKDMIYCGGSVFNTDGDCLFSGWKNFYLVSSDSGKTYLPPDGYGKIDLELQDTIPIKIEGVMYAQLDILDGEGRSRNFYNLNVRDGKVYFQTALAGTNAIIGVYSRTTDSSGQTTYGWKYWSAKDSKLTNQMIPLNEVSVTVKGVKNITDGDIIVEVPTTNGIGDNITVEYKSTKVQNVTVSFLTSEWKWYKGIRVKKVGAKDWEFYTPVLDSTKEYYYINVMFDVGTYYIVPDWAPESLKEPTGPWYPPYYYDGGARG